MPARSWSKGTDHAAQYPRRRKSSITATPKMLDEKEVTEAIRDGVISPSFAKQVFELVSSASELLKYKSAADEALSYALEFSDDVKVRQLALVALNAGAHKKKKTT